MFNAAERLRLAKKADACVANDELGALEAMVREERLLGPGAGKGKLATVAGGQRAVKSFQYTTLGDVQQVDECADGASFATTYQYDALGRQSVIRYPAVNTSQLAVGYHYTSLGYLQYLTDESSDYAILWQAKAMNVLGQVTDEQMRNGVETVSNRNPMTGWLLGSTATAHADQDTVIQDWSYSFDEIGNLLTRDRADIVNAVTSAETFTYDLTNRLLTSALATSGGYSKSEPYAYDALGNLTQKAGSPYTYGAGCQAGSRTAGPHAVCTVAGGTAFGYDGNGNLTSSGGRSLTYNPSNKVTHAENSPASSGAVDIMYGADGNRVVQVATSGTVTSRTVYVGLGSTGKSLYERTTTTGAATQHVHFIYAGGAHGGAPFALRVLDGTGSVTANRYYSVDHLGSVTAMSDDRGHVSVTGSDPTMLGYDAWGARRNPDGTAAAPASFNLPVGHRQFTGQEQMPAVGLVNMNGRMYDPTLGRFLSPDPNVQFVADLQSYNRYSYVSNNPLRYTDPTGYFWNGMGTFFSNTFSNPMTYVGIGGALLCVGGPAGCAIAVGLTLAITNATIAIANGAAWDQTVLNASIGMGIGLATGGLAQSAGLNGWQGLIVGAASAAVSTGVANFMSGHDFFEWNMLGSAMLTAATSAATMGLEKVIALSQASADAHWAEGARGSGSFSETVSGPAGDEPSGEDGMMAVGHRGKNVLAAVRNRYIMRTLDGMAQPSGENSTYFYSEGQTMGDTGAHAGTDDSTHSNWAPKSEVPPGATPFGQGHTHPTGSQYLGAEARNPIHALETDIRMSLQERTNSWVRLTTGETVVIDPNSRMIYQLRGPANGLSAAFPQPVAIPRDIVLSTPVRTPSLGI